MKYSELPSADAEVFDILQGEGRREMEGLELIPSENYVSPAVLEAQVGLSRPRLDCGHLWKSPHNVYPCRGEDRWIAIVVSDDTEWQSLRQTMGNPSWAADPKFDSTQGRWENRHELDQLLAEWTRDQDDRELTEKLQAQGVTAGSALTAQDLVNDPHLKHRGFFWEFDNPHSPRVGPRIFAGRPFRIPGIPMGLDHVAALGEHNTAVLEEIGGLSSEEIENLAQAGVISDRPKPAESAP